MEWEIIYAERGPGFQEYVYKNGDPVLSGTPIGVEHPEIDELWLLSGIRYSNEGSKF